MKSFILPFGSEAWKQKTAILDEVMSSRPCPPYLYNDILILVPSSRLKRTYGRLFLQLAERKGSAALVQPEVLTFSQFLEKQFARLGSWTLIDENSRLVLLEGIVKERLSGNLLFNQKPDLLAPSLSSSLAAMIEQVAAAAIGADEFATRIENSDFADRPQVKLLVDVYTRYEDALREKNLVDPAGMRMHLRDRFDPGWIADYRAVIIDGIQDVQKLEAEILRKIAGSNKTLFLIEGPSEETITRAGKLHPLTLLRDFISGMKAVPERTGAVTDASDIYLSSALFSDKSFSEVAEAAPDPASFKKKIYLLSALNMREEVSCIARKVKESLGTGTPADSILVAFPALDEYAPLVEEIFTDYGIPYNRALGRQLSASGVGGAVISLLRSCQEDFFGPSLLRVFGSPFLKFSEHAETGPALDRFLRREKITGGRQKILSALKYYHRDENGQDILNHELEELFTNLQPFSTQESAPLSEWMKRLAQLLAWSGVSARVALIKGPLNINLQAYKKMNEALASLTRAGKLFPDYRYTFNEWLFLLKKTFMHTRFQVPPEDEGGVQVLGLEETTGHPWNEIYFGGLAEGKFPRRLPQNIFLPEELLEGMGIDTLERARLTAAYHFYRLLLSSGKITLTCPENEGEKPVMPSPFLEELTPLRNAGLVNSDAEQTSGIQFSLKIEESKSIPELAKSISIAGNIARLDELLNSRIDGIQGIASAVAYRRTKQPAPVVPVSKRLFRVTELDAYLHCPYDYYIAAVLRIAPLEEVTDDLSPLDRGSKVHAILRNFYLSWGTNRQVTRENREEARTLLHNLAASAFDNEADTFRNRREKELFLTVMSQRFLDAEEYAWKQGFKPAFLEQKIELPLLRSNGEEVMLSAKIDRIDVEDNGNFIIVDYKTGKYPLPKMNGDQDIFQLPVYAAMAREALSPAIRQPIGLAYYDLSGKTGGPPRDVVLYDREARDDHSSSKPKASSKSGQEFEAILKESMDKARRAIEGILAGDFPAVPRDENKCRYCPNGEMCGGLA